MLAASPSMLSSRLKAFVIPTSQTIPSDPREHVVVDDLDRDAAREDERRGGDLRPELGGGSSGLTSSARPATKRIAQPARIAATSAVDSIAAEHERGADGGGEAGEDADAAERRRGRLCHRSALGRR